MEWKCWQLKKKLEFGFGERGTHLICHFSCVYPSKKFMMLQGLPAAIWAHLGLRAHIFHLADFFRAFTSQNMSSHTFQSPWKKSPFWNSSSDLDYPLWGKFKHLLTPGVLWWLTLTRWMTFSASSWPAAPNSLDAVFHSGCPERSPELWAEAQNLGGSRT